MFNSNANVGAVKSFCYVESFSRTCSNIWLWLGIPANQRLVIVALLLI